MNDAMYIAATGIQAQKTLLDVVANNVANINTPGFKRASLQFHDLMVAPSAQAAQDGMATVAAEPEAALRMAAGVAVSSIGKQFDGGELKPTGSAMDLAIKGPGFFEVTLPDGGVAYSRGGTLQINAEGLLATIEGHALKQRIQVPADAKALTIAADGQVQMQATSGHVQSLGRIDLIQFANPSALQPIGDKLYQASAGTGEALVLPAAEGGAGSFAQGYLESSNVKLVDEMVHLMMAQRAYEMNVKVMQAADELASLTNNLRK
jgi:flagellar basal-body rod protein FlgG